MGDSLRVYPDEGAGKADSAVHIESLFLIELVSFEFRPFLRDFLSWKLCYDSEYGPAAFLCASP